MKVLLSITALLLSLPILAQHNHSHDEKRFIVEFKVSTKKERSELATTVHFDDIQKNSARAVLNAHDLHVVKTHFSKYIKSVKPLELSKLSNNHPHKHLEDEYEFPTGDEKFHTYDEVITKFKKLAKDNPSFVTYSSLGQSVEGREIPMLRITPKENLSSNAFIPGILFTGTHHAREHLSTEVPVKLAEFLVKEYKINDEVKTLVNSRDIYIAPLINPDGALHDIKNKRYKMWRKNRTLNSNGSYGVDLNRNYSFGWGTGGSSRNPRSDVYMGPAPFSEPETISIKQFIENKPNIRIFLSYHTYSELILYPWGGKDDTVIGKDGETFKKMAITMSKWNNYKPMQASGLYIASGDTCDWAYGEHGIFCFTFELSPKNRWGGGGFYPGAKVIEPTFKANIKPALFLIKRAGNVYNDGNES